MIQLTVNIDDINYERAAELILPALLSQADSGGEKPLWARFLSNAPELGTSAARAVLAGMSEDRKNELLAAYVNRNKEKIAGLLSDMALGKGIELKISSVGAKSIPEA
ncbi:MAG: hypothetical protein K5855_09690 [Oscillospiraceae bacterium]|jgi:hypothetical protein|nr:hypothetical protein [Oscillospiraceae bacterium]